MGRSSRLRVGETIGLINRALAGEDLGRNAEARAVLLATHDAGDPFDVLDVEDAVAVDRVERLQLDLRPSGDAVPWPSLAARVFTTTGRRRTLASATR
jgi:hypothetical protein